MSIERASRWLSEMISAEAKALDGDAVAIIGRRCGLSYWPTYRLMRRDTKRLDVDAFERIKAAYRDFCLKQIAALEHEIAVEIESGANDLDDLTNEIAALAAKAEAIKARLN